MGGRLLPRCASIAAGELKGVLRCKRVLIPLVRCCRGALLSGRPRLQLRTWRAAAVHTRDCVRATDRASSVRWGAATGRLDGGSVVGREGGGGREIEIMSDECRRRRERRGYRNERAARENFTTLVGGADEWPGGTLSSGRQVIEGASWAVGVTPRWQGVGSDSGPSRKSRRHWDSRSASVRRWTGRGLSLPRRCARQ